jgi:hypothetical protein
VPSSTVEPFNSSTTDVSTRVPVNSGFGKSSNFSFGALARAAARETSFV